MLPTKIYINSGTLQAFDMLPTKNQRFEGADSAPWPGARRGGAGALDRRGERRDRSLEPRAGLLLLRARRPDPPSLASRSLDYWYRDIFRVSLYRV